jgi:hypothetical protein
MSSMKAKVGLERMQRAALAGAASSTTSSVSRRDRAPATVLRRPDRYSTVKSKPKSLLRYGGEALV